jgi:hypothetical protein
MAKAARQAKRGNKRRLFDELMSGVKAMREHREGRLTLRTHRRLVEEGVRNLDEGRAVPHEQVMREAAEWLRKR